jgi:HAD superfamily hydrolase (TIGR01509 family)
MVDTVCLDVMGTVLYDPYLEAIEAGTGMALADVVKIRDPRSWPDFEMGLIDEAEFVRRFFLAADEPPAFDLAAFHRVRRAGYRFLPGMEKLLGDLRGAVTRYAASNYPVWIEELAHRFDFARHFDGVVASCHLGVRKPDPEFFAKLLAAIDRPAHACLFVDDRVANCDAAASVGMAAHLFDGADGLRVRLVDEGVLDGETTGRA